MSTWLRDSDLAARAIDASYALSLSQEYLWSLPKMKRLRPAETYFEAVTAIERAMKCLEDIAEYLEGIEDMAWTESKPLSREEP